jgi:hypothetical protein
MFGKKEKQAIACLPPQHQALLNDGALAVTQSKAQWAALFTSLATPQPEVHRHRLPGRLMDVVVPLLRVVSEDVDKDAGIGVRLDLRGHEAAGKVGPSRDLPTHGNITKLSESTAWDPWLVVDTDLKDGSHLELAVVDVVRMRKIRKRSRSGKTKWKQKAKPTQRVTAKLTLPKDRGINPPAPSPATSWLKVAAKPKGSRFVVTAQGKYQLPHNPQPGWQVNTVLLVVAEVFRWVAPAAPGADGDGSAPVPPAAPAPMAPVSPQPGGIA